MKEVLMMVLSLCLLVCMTFISRADDQARKKEGQATRRAGLLKYDKNGDGKIDESERTALKEERRKNGKGNKDSEPKKESGR
jgi:uncharacterized membrane protein